MYLFFKIWAPCCSELLHGYSFARPSNSTERFVVKLGIGSVHVRHAIRNVQNEPGLLKSKAPLDLHFGCGRTWRDMCCRTYVRRINTLTLVVSSPPIVHLPSKLVTHRFMQIMRSSDPTKLVQPSTNQGPPGCLPDQAKTRAVAEHEVHNHERVLPTSLGYENIG